MVEKSENIGNLVKALSSAQGSMGNITKDKTASMKSDKANYSYRYADLASVLEEVRPILAEYEIAVYQAATNGDKGGATVTTMLMHSSGEYLSSSLTMPVAQQTPQAFGSAISYARRYALLAALGLATEDDDGETAGKSAPQPAPRVASYAAPTPSAAPITPSIASEAQIKALQAVLSRLGFKERPERLSFMSWILKTPIGSSKTLGFEGAKTLLTRLGKPDAAELVVQWRATNPTLGDVPWEQLGKDDDRGAA